MRDKDAVNAAFMICEMFACYKARGISLIGKLEELYRRYGYCLNTLHSYQFEGSEGMGKMQGIMEALRGPLQEIGGLRVERKVDYKGGAEGLPPSNVLKFYLDGGSTIVARPSGTEPKLKLYLSVTAPDRESAKALEARLSGDMGGHMGG